jgi:iron complex outermembrane receptor protein
MTFSSIRSPNDAIVSGVVSPARTAILAAVLALAPFARADNTNKPTSAPDAEPVPLSPLVVSATPTIETHLAEADLASLRSSTSDTASLLQDIPGVSLYGAGGVSSLLAIDGLADDRVRILVDGLQSTPACANHMNPPLSYIDPTSVRSVAVFAGIAPVSVGGDSIGGTIRIDSAPPEFAPAGQGILIKGQAGTFYRNNGTAKGGNIAATIADQNLSVTYSGSTAESGDYKDGHGNTVTSTYYKSSNQALTFAVEGNGNEIVVRVGHQSIPRQGFANEQMDMVSNQATFLNIDYTGTFDWGTLDGRAYRQDTRHEMNLGADKLTFPMPMIMPMDTCGRDTGYSLKAEIPVAREETLRLGSEFHRFTLNDWWPPVPGTDPWMAPDTFQSINNGRRAVLSVFAEWESKWSQQVTTLLGVRNETVQTDTGNVQGYSTDPTPGYFADATAFNARGHARHDNNWDLTALARFEPDSKSTYEFGYARKARSPNLYERYAWSTNWMASGMINWFGDGNYYVGNLDLKPESAHTLSATADWHDSARQRWELKATPYYTYVQDYIGVNVIGTSTYGESTFNQLQFANHSAELYGLDVSGFVGLWDNNSSGTGRLKGTLGYVHGKSVATGDSLYHLMPLNARLVLEQKVSGWTNAIEWQLVDRKSQVDPLRYEPKTGGYGLVNLRTGYEWKSARVDLGVTNLFNRFYYLPLGGVNFDDYLASGWMGKIGPLAGPGRSLDARVTVKF